MFEKWCSSSFDVRAITTMISFQIFSLRFLLHGWIDSCISCPNHLCKSWLTNLCFGSLDSEMPHVMRKRYLGVRRTYILRCTIVPLIFSDILGTIWHYHELIFGLTNAKSPMKRSTGFWDDRRELGLEHRWMYLAHLPSSRHSAPVLRKM